MSDFQARYERLELKYLPDELTAERIRAQITPYCTPDPHSREFALDRPGAPAAPSTRCIWTRRPSASNQANLRNDLDRLELRLRTTSDTSPATLELKRRYSEVIDKTRPVADRRPVEHAARSLLSRRDGGDTPIRAASATSRMWPPARASPTPTIAYQREACDSLVDVSRRSS
jgi:hypothetical protein